ncbi:VWA domain-containing protein [Thermomicrobium sp. CFH 73360]|uniref:vWA domain-containing protein n=1 Tax=Thermomicrobium sp. CFH 73360 TaxID=2951987 RepID=UPI0020769CE3|nr:VWA domain-containing protein [Thermomicrobium sp. CFH 73360]MCM8745086.1 VWA domain-containing protein [Thermomicrobium sp. CFH 73360]
MTATMNFAQRALAFARLLRRAGVKTTTGQAIDFVRAIEHIDISRREELREAARACLVTHKDDMPVFDRLFDLYWRAKPEYTDGLLQQAEPDDVIELAPEEGEETEEADGTTLSGARGRRLEAVEAAEEGDTGEASDEESLADTFSYSPAEVLREKDFADFTEEELQQIRRFMQQLTWEIGRRRSRRKIASSKGRFIDPRRTMRRSLQTGGVPLTIARRETKTKPRQLVVICDVSGSMDRYSRILLQFIYAIENGMAKVEAFVFGTRLTRVTRLLKHQDIDEAMRRVAREVQDWSGGTRIGQSLQTFNQEWARRVLRNGAVVLIISDGWDRGDPQLLAQEMARLQRSCYRLIWLNPLLGSPRYEPLTRGMQAALPYIDDFMPIHNFASLEALAKHLSQIDDKRPVRRQHAVLPETTAA